MDGVFNFLKVQTESLVPSLMVEQGGFLVGFVLVSRVEDCLLTGMKSFPGAVSV